MEQATDTFITYVTKMIKFEAICHLFFFYILSILKIFGRRIQAKSGKIGVCHIVGGLLYNECRKEIIGPLRGLWFLATGSLPLDKFEVYECGLGIYSCSKVEAPISVLLYMSTPLIHPT